jgi:hypothetical protein
VGPCLNASTEISIFAHDGTSMGKAKISDSQPLAPGNSRCQVPAGEVVPDQRLGGRWRRNGDERGRLRRLRRGRGQGTWWTAVRRRRIIVVDSGTFSLGIALSHRLTCQSPLPSRMPSRGEARINDHRGLLTNDTNNRLYSL